eukprot:2919142-Prorocentrum_lima.AAC.1
MHGLRRQPSSGGPRCEYQADAEKLQAAARNPPPEGPPAVGAEVIYRQVPCSNAASREAEGDQDPERDDRLDQEAVAADAAQ